MGAARHALLSCSDDGPGLVLTIQVLIIRRQPKTLASMLAYRFFRVGSAANMRKLTRRPTPDEPAPGNLIGFLKKREQSCQAQLEIE